MLVGYVRCLYHRLNLDLQRDALLKAGCEKIFEEKKSGKAGTKRPEFDAALAYLRTEMQTSDAAYVNHQHRHPPHRAIFTTVTRSPGMKLISMPRWATLIQEPGGLSISTGPSRILHHGLGEPALRKRQRVGDGAPPVAPF